MTSRTLRRWSCPTRCQRAAPRPAATFASSSSTRFSPRSTQPAATAARATSGGWVLVTATTATEAVRPSGVARRLARSEPRTRPIPLGDLLIGHGGHGRPGARTTSPNWRPVAGSARWLNQRPVRVAACAAADALDDGGRPPRAAPRPRPCRQVERGRAPGGRRGRGRVRAGDLVAHAGRAPRSSSRRWRGRSPRGASRRQVTEARQGAQRSHRRPRARTPARPACADRRRRSGRRAAPGRSRRSGPRAAGPGSAVTSASTPRSSGAGRRARVDDGDVRAVDLVHQVPARWARSPSRRRPCAARPRGRPAGGAGGG